MAWLSLLILCGIFLASGHCALYKKEEIFKRAVCEGGSITLEEGKINEATPTTKSIKDEANEKEGSKLFQAYTSLTESTDYEIILLEGKKLGLSRDETEAVRLYTMDDINLYGELNGALRVGNNKYPVLHYWIDRALAKLPKYNDILYRGIPKTVYVDVGTKLRLPGFSSASELEGVAQVFSKGCTIMIFDSSKQAGSVIELSRYPEEREHLIPPTERFEIYNRSSDDRYQYIYLRPTGISMPATTYSPILLVLVVIQRFF